MKPTIGQRYLHCGDRSSTRYHHICTITNITTHRIFTKYDLTEDLYTYDDKGRHLPVEARYTPDWFVKNMQRIVPSISPVKVSHTNINPQDTHMKLTKVLIIKGCRALEITEEQALRLGGEGKHKTYTIQPAFKSNGRLFKAKEIPQEELPPVPAEENE